MLKWHRRLPIVTFALMGVLLLVCCLMVLCDSHVARRDQLGLFVQNNYRPDVALTAALSHGPTTPAVSHLNIRRVHAFFGTVVLMDNTRNVALNPRPPTAAAASRI